ncbi:hypothetical protein [Flavobacterium sp.]|uniref:hypothetical protein n=1 Tax=Flavobacterium sp. TaxID=239 RepID=UPI0031D5B4BA
MSTKVPQNTEDQEIDIFQISKSIGNFFDRMNTKIFRAIQFFIRNWIILAVLVVLGFGIGWLIDSKSKSYENEIIVTPNFGSIDYLYSKIDLVQSKILSGDTIFLKQIVGINKPENLQKIEIKPISDVYNFIKNKPENFELIKLLAEDSDINKVIEQNTTSKNYAFQKIFILTDEKISEDGTVKPLMDYLNDSDYYRKLQKEVCNNAKTKIIQNDSIIKQIDGVLKNFSNSDKYSSKGDKLLYNNENAQLNDMIKTKDYLLVDQGTHKLELIGFDKIIKDSSSVLNIESRGILSNKWKFLIPVVFIVLFIFLNLFNLFYNNQKIKQK